MSKLQMFIIRGRDRNGSSDGPKNVLRAARSAEEALRDYLAENYAIRQRTGRNVPFVPIYSYEVYTLSDPITLLVEPIVAHPFKIKVAL